MSGAVERRLIVHASEILTGIGVRKKDGRRVSEEDLGRIEDGAVVYSDRIEWVGRTDQLPQEYRNLPTRDLERKRAVVPGLVDCHTHLVFAGNRADEFARRCAGATYEEIAAAGGGILTTVRATGQASEAELLKLAEERLAEAMSYGVRTLEMKSGYGLDFETELKTLRVHRELRKRHPEVTIASTFLGAHAIPSGVSRETYLSEVCDRMLPAVARDRLAEACDVFVDEGYFTVEEGRKILGKARSLGLQVKVHADELGNTESAKLAAELGALSADHLLKVSEKGIRALADSNTVAVLLPGTAFYLKTSQAPARRLIDAGAKVALSTDFNPGTCVTLNLPFIMSLAALQLGMSRAEIFAAVTYNAASALGLQENKGTLEVGRDPDLWVMPFSSFEEAYYRLAWAGAIQR